MKRIRLMSLFLSWACLVCLCSVGFASWYQLDPVNVGANGNFVSYDVVGMDEFIHAEVSMFEYSHLSFVNSNGGGKNEADSGQISVAYTIDLAKAKAAMAAEGKSWNGTLTVGVSLSYENIAEYDNNSNFAGLFLLPTSGVDTTQEKKTITVKVDGSVPTGTVNNSGTEIYFTHKLTGLGTTGVANFNVVYNFDIPKCYTNGTVGNFSYHFGRYLKTADNKVDGKATRFITTARIVDLLE